MSDFDDIPDTPEQRAMIAEHNAKMRHPHPNMVEISYLGKCCVEGCGAERARFNEACREHAPAFCKPPPRSAELKEAQERIGALQVAILRSFGYVSQARPAQYETAILKVGDTLSAALEADLERAWPPAEKATS